MDWDVAARELSKKLNPAHVKERKQGGGQVQYIVRRKTWRHVR